MTKLYLSPASSEKMVFPLSLSPVVRVELGEKSVAFDFFVNTGQVHAVDFGQREFINFRAADKGSFGGG